MDKTILELAHMEGINVSQTMEDLLTQYLSVDSVEKLDEEIKKNRDAVKILEMKKHDLLQKGIAKNKSAGMNGAILDSLKNTYSKRRDQNQSLSTDENWIVSPKNLQKCRMLGKQPLELLHDLREWYDKR